MKTFSEDLIERTAEESRQAVFKQVILNMNDLKYSLDDIANAVGMSKNEVAKIMKNISKKS